MSGSDIIAIIALILSTATAILSFIATSIATRKMAQTQMLLLHAQTEIQMRTLIFTAKESLQRAKTENASKEFIRYAQEELAKMYEDICGQYLNNKIDKAYFEAAYMQEISNFVTNKENKFLYGDVSEYPNTDAVYKSRFKKTK